MPKQTNLRTSFFAAERAGLQNLGNLVCAPGVPRGSGFAATAKRDAKGPVLKCGIFHTP
jgi:hypothetical protein